jgi:hypothetical protein
MTSKFKLLWTKIKDAFKIDTTPIESRNGGSINFDLTLFVRDAGVWTFFARNRSQFDVFVWGALSSAAPKAFGLRYAWPRRAPVLGGSNARDPPASGQFQHLLVFERCCARGRARAEQKKNVQTPAPALPAKFGQHLPRGV